MTRQITFEDACKEALQLIKDRKLDKTNDDRGTAISLSLEANELLEYFQWGDTSFGTKKDLASELADVFIYAIQFADRFDIDIPTAISSKVAKMNRKYPKEIFDIEDKKERDKAWLEAKRNYAKDTTL